MKFDRKLFMLPAIMLLFIAGIIFLGIRPKVEKIASLEKRVNELEGNALSKITQRTIDLKRADVDSLRLMFTEIEKRNYKWGDLSNLGVDFENLGKKQGLKILFVRPDYTSLTPLSESGDDVFELPFTVQFEGAFSQWTKFIDDIPSFPFAMRIESILMEKNEASDKTLKCTMGGYIVFMRKISETKAKNT